MTTNETLKQSAKKAIEERERILKQQVENLYSQNMENIEDMKEALMPILSSLKQMILLVEDVNSQTFQMQNQLLRTSQQAGNLIEEQRSILQKTIKTKKAISIKIILLSILIGSGAGALTFLAVLWMR